MLGLASHALACGEKGVKISSPTAIAGGICNAAGFCFSFGFGGSGGWSSANFLVGRGLFSCRSHGKIAAGGASGFGFSCGTSYHMSFGGSG
jgi:hypothetical protein